MLNTINGRDAVILLGIDWIRRVRKVKEDDESNTDKNIDTLINLLLYSSLRLRLLIIFFRNGILIEF